MSNRKSLTMIVAGLSTALALTACSKTVDAATFPTASISNVAYSEQEAKQLPSDGTITEAGVYKVSGNITTPITVNAPKDASVVLRLDGATINSTVSIKQAGDAVLYVAGDSSISSTDGHGVDSKNNLTIDGPGKLTVTSKDKDAIHSDENLTVTGGTLEISAGDDGLKAVKNLTIDGGTINVSKSNEALEALNVTINNGTVTTHSTDDGVNASLDDGLADQNATPSITINGGTVKVYADADGLDSNGDLTITGGSITVVGPTTVDNGSFDADGTFTIAGGTVVGIGSGGMPQTPTVGQGWVQQNVTVKGQDRVKVTDSNDAEVVSLTAEQAATSLFVSTPQIMEGQTYKVTSGSATTEVVAGENAQGGFGPGPGGFGGPGSGGSNDLGVVPPENGGLRAPALTGSSRRGETNQPTDGSSS